MERYNLLELCEKARPGDRREAAQLRQIYNQLLTEVESLEEQYLNSITSGFPNSDLPAQIIVLQSKMIVLDGKINLLFSKTNSNE